jgi:hypothetical protein
MLNTNAPQGLAATPWTTPTLKSGHISQHTSITPAGFGADFGVFS